jgi:hemoglobin
MPSLIFANSGAVSGAARRKLAASLLALSIVVSLSGCATSPSGPDAPLFARMGGMPTINKVVGETIDAMVADPKTRRSFDGIKLPTLKESIAQQFCVLAGGPCKYEGEVMRKAHKGLNITDSEFDLMVAALRTSLDRYVGEREKNELLRLLAPMKRDVVGV